MGGEACTLRSAESSANVWRNCPPDRCDVAGLPSPAAPVLALVVPSYRFATCRDIGRTEKPSRWFASRTMSLFCLDFTPNIEVAAGR